MFKSQIYANILNVFKEFADEVKFFKIERSQEINLYKINKIIDNSPDSISIVTTSVSGVVWNERVNYELHEVYTFDFRLQCGGIIKQTDFEGQNRLADFLNNLTPLNEDEYKEMLSNLFNGVNVFFNKKAAIPEKIISK